MKKKLLGIMAVSAIVTFAGYNVYVSHSKEVKLSKLLLANVEALAQNESGDSKKCTVIDYVNIESGGCLYYCAKCAEGHYQIISVRGCDAR